jgi:hypothetical protein
VLGHGLFDVDRAVVHGLAKSVNVRSEALGHLQQVGVVAVAQEDEVESQSSWYLRIVAQSSRSGDAPPSCAREPAAARCRCSPSRARPPRRQVAPDGRDLDDGTSVDQVSRPGRGQRGRDPISLERGPADQAGVPELAEGFLTGVGDTPSCRARPRWQGIGRGQPDVQQHPGPRRRRCLERPALDDRAAACICASCTPAPAARRTS